MSHMASGTAPPHSPGGCTFSWNKRTEAILKKWEPIFKASAVHWKSYWYFEGRTAALCWKGEHEGTLLYAGHPTCLTWESRCGANLGGSQEETVV